MSPEGVPGETGGGWPPGRGNPAGDNDTMKIHKIAIRNILGIEALEFSPGAITRITGGNGQGKTSVLEALKSICKGGYDATLLRHGQTKGEIVLDLDDGLTISKRITQKGAYLAVTKDGETVAKPADFLGGLWDSLSANPVEFMTSSKRKRIDWLLEQLDPEPIIDQLRSITQQDTGDLDGANALTAMDRARKSIFDERTEINRTAKQASETAEVLARDLPPDSGDVAAELATASGESEKARGAYAQAGLEIREAARKELESAERDREAELDRLRLEMDKVRQTYQEHADKVHEMTQVQLTELTELHTPIIRAASDEVARLQEAQRTADEAAGRRKLLAQNQLAATDAKTQAEALSAKLDKIDALKKTVLASLPIPGVEVIDGDIHKDGVPFERLNTATQWAVAIAIAKMRAGKLPLICADGLEALDDANFAAFAKMAEASGLYFVVTDRGNGPLTVDPSGSRG